MVLPSKSTCVFTHAGVYTELKLAIGKSCTVIKCSTDFEHPLFEIHVSLIIQFPGVGKECTNDVEPGTVENEPPTGPTSHTQLTISSCGTCPTKGSILESSSHVS